MSTERVFVVDRVDGRHAVLVDDAGATVNIATGALPAGAAEGILLRVPVGPDGQPDWKAARVDQAETARRRAEAEDRLKRLRKQDPGGDVAL